MVTGQPPALPSLAGQTLKDALPVSKAHIFREPVKLKPGHLGGVRSGPQRSSTGLAQVDEDIRRLSRVVGDPDGVKQIANGDLEARLLRDLPPGSLPGILVNLLVASWQGPEAPVGLQPSPDQENPGAVTHNSSNPGRWIPEVNKSASLAPWAQPLLHGSGLERIPAEGAEAST